MQESSVVWDNSAGSGGGAASATEEVVVGVENGGGGGEGGNRWPREETLALLKIRSELDLAFRDSTIKAPLWDEVSRKLGELGYQRSARKCKEKFENIFKYHKRTKDCRSGRQNGKNYRYFEQLEIFDNQSSLPSPPTNQIQPSGMETTSIAEPTAIKPASHDFIVSCPAQKSMEFVTPSTSMTSSSGRESRGSVKRKRKLADYFEKLMKEVLDKQENLQNQLLNALEKCEKDRIAREEAWKIQQIDRINRQREFLARERAVAAAKDATVMAFLQKISEQKITVQFPGTPAPMSEKQQLQTLTPLPANIDKQDTLLEKSSDKQENVSEKDTAKQANGASENSFQSSTSRWPKAEVEALIKVRTTLGMHFQDNGLKGPVWEEISSAMKKLGYDRSAKRCKEKWENVNKYYKRVKESHKKRPESSKTCPYFHMLESLYERKSKRVEHIPDLSGTNLNPEDILMQMTSQQEQQQPKQLTTDGLRENVDQSGEDEADEDEEDDDNGEGYQLVANNPSSVASME